MKVILITGAAGFVGSHLSEACLGMGYRVIGSDDFSSGLRRNLKFLKNKHFSLLKVDLADRNAAARIAIKLEKIGVKPDCVIHLAARKIPRYGGRLDTLRVNINATETACLIAAKYRAKLIFASTSDVYGLTPDIPFKEDGKAVFGSSAVGRWSYGASKYIGEQLVWGFNEEYKIPIVILRIFGVYGPRAVEGWRGNAVSAFFEQAKSGGPMELHGDGKQTRSFVFIDDLIVAILRAVKMKSCENRIINVGSKETVSMRKLAKEILYLVKPEAKLRFKYISYKSFTGKEYQDIMAKVPNLNFAKKYLSWKPATSLGEGLKKTADWYLTSR